MFDEVAQLDLIQDLKPMAHSNISNRLKIDHAQVVASQLFLWFTFSKRYAQSVEKL